MATNPLLESRIRDIQSGAAQRAAKRAEVAAKQAGRERKSQAFYVAQDEDRRSISPNGLTAQQRHSELIDYYAGLHQVREREADIAEMARLKAEYSLKSTTASRKNYIVKRYATLHRRYVEGTTPEMVEKSWEQEQRQATLHKIFGAVEAS